MSARPRGHAPWRPGPAALALVELARELMEAEDQFLVRRALYLASERGLMNAAGVPLNKQNPNHYETVSNALTRARRAGLIPWDAVIDTTERVEPDEFESPEDFRRAVVAWAENYRVARQAGQPGYLVAWSEHRGLRNVLGPVCADYGLPLVLSGGFDSTGGRWTEARRARQRADHARAARQRDMPTTVLHFGDRDTAGERIFRVLEEDLRQLSAGCVEHVIRVALTVEQMRELHPTATTMQVDAMPVPLLRNLLESEVVTRQDADARQAGLDREATERAEVVAWANGLAS